jgi:spore maturation protein CgeB
MKNNDEKCLICQKNSAGFFAQKNGHDMFKCRKCGLIFVFPVPTRFEELCQKEYPSIVTTEGGKEKADVGWEATEETFLQYLDIIESFKSEKGNLFDVGAATGIFINAAAKRGWDAKGIELLPHDIAMEKEKNGNFIVSGNFEEYHSEEGQYDLVTFWDVLEHFPHPDLAVENAQRLLKSGGTLAINTPDTASVLARLMGKRWHLLMPPSHLHCFNMKNVRLLLQQHGFEIIYVGRIGKKFTLSSVCKVLVMWQKLILWKKLYAYLSQSRLGDIKISINTRDNMFLIAKKR